MISLVCLALTALNTNAQNIEKEYKVSAFTELDVHSVGNVHLIQGNKESVKIESNKDVSDYMVVENTGNKLQVHTKDLHNWNGKLNIYITYRNLTNITIKTAGNILSDNTMKAKNLTIRCNATGNITLNTQCASLTTNFSAVGNIRFSGNANEASFTCTGTGNISTEALLSNNLSLNLKGVGNVVAFASKEISIDASGTGNITYKGKPSVKQIIKHGTGTVKGE